MFRRRRDPRQRLGRRGERIAARVLRRKGYRILGRNVRLGRYEVDLIARQKDTVAFVEVKTRRDDSLTDPGANITAAKKRHLRGAARHYLARYAQEGLNYRFDVVCVVAPPLGKAHATVYPNAFPDE